MTTQRVRWSAITAVFAGLFVLAFTAESRAQNQPQPQNATSDPVDVAADLDDQKRRVLGLSRGLMSPFCPGRTLISCSSRGASAWIADIRTWVARGDSDEEIVQRLQSRVPDFDVSANPGGVWNWSLGLIAICSMSLMMLWLGFRLVRARRDASASTPVPADPAVSEVDADEPEDELEIWEDRLDEELARYDDNGPP